jgi:hypothetical protein
MTGPYVLAGWPSTGGQRLNEQAVGSSTAASFQIMPHAGRLVEAR